MGFAFHLSYLIGIYNIEKWGFILGYLVFGLV